MSAVALASEQASMPARILVADDNYIDRCYVERLLQNQGHEVILASNGEEAIEKFDSEAPDAVLLDVLMPGLHGYEIAPVLKKMAGERFVPLIFLTGIQDESLHAKCIASGGDDFLNKPCSALVMQAKLDAFFRLRGLHQKTAEQNAELERSRRQVQREQEAAEKLYTKLARLDRLEAPNLLYSLSPVAVFNGDLILASPTPLGGLHVMLGDFTGHGLVAAIGALPSSEIFYGMTKKGFSIDAIAEEINLKLANLLPTGYFLAATLLSLDAQCQSLSVWCGGMPEALVVGGDHVRHHIESTKLPLGISASMPFDDTLQNFAVEEGDRVYLYSDGVVEASNAEQEMFGQERLQTTLLEAQSALERIGFVTEAISRFRGEDEQRDDITLLEVSCDASAMAAPEQAQTRSLVKPAMDWRCSLELDANALRTTDPLPLILQMVTEIQGLGDHRAPLYTVLAELYSNALEHGVLGLSSALKSGADGFAEYYRERERRLQELNDGTVEFQIRHLSRDEGGRLEICIRDSGGGFSCLESFAEAGAEQLCGRGITVIRELTQALSYEDNGRTARAVYDW